MTQTAAKPVPTRPGIYFGMPNEAYHADPALGSTNLRKLANNPSDYWYESPLNPHRDIEKVTPARVRGAAMHTLVLEGEPAFDKLYLCGPHHSDDMSPSEKGAATKAANQKAAASGKTMLPAEDYDRIAIAGAMITKNPKLATVFTGGAPEVSVFWERDGIMYKVRFDYLKPRGIGDLKSITNTRDKPFPDACYDAIANYRYDVQGAHYLEGRRQMPQLIKDGLVFRDPSADIRADQYTDLLEKVAAAPKFAFQWIFFQSDKAPVTYSAILSPANPMVRLAEEEIIRAEQNYRRYMTEFGPDQMWLLIEDPKEIELESMPGWFGRRRD
jgi:hypothetical protein